MGRSRYSMPKVLSGPELAAKGFMDLGDRGGVITPICSYCGKKSGPMGAVPALKDPSGRLRGHLVRSKCGDCQRRGVK